MLGGLTIEPEKGTKIEFALAKLGNASHQFINPGDRVTKIGPNVNGQTVFVDSAENVELIFTALQQALPEKPYFKLEGSLIPDKKVLLVAHNLLSNDEIATISTLADDPKDTFEKVLKTREPAAVAR